jgi:hypothetical protein
MRARRLSLSALLCAGALAATALGCGDAHVDANSHGAATTAQVSAQALQAARAQQDGDRDNDTLGLGPLDDDGDGVPTYGPVAGKAATAPIVAMLERYFAAAAADRVSTVCSMLYPVAVERLVEEHSHGAGAASQRGSSCRQIVAKLLRQQHSELVAKRASLKVRLVELRAKHAWVVLDFGRGKENVVLLHHEGSTWSLTEIEEQAL